MTARTLGVHVRLFRLLLKAYPAWFRHAHAAEMEDLFLARLRRARGPFGALALWARTVRDGASTAIAIRRGRTARPARRSAPGDLDMLWQDTRHGIRQLIRTPIFTLGAIALLAIGIGANVAVFTLVDRLMLRPLPYAQPDRVVHIYQDSDTGEPASNAFPAYRDMAGSNVFDAVMATSPSIASWDEGEVTTDVSIEFTTASHLAVTGLEMLRGRWFSGEHDSIGAEPVAVVSAPAWRARFQSAPGVVGRTVHLNGTPVTIIGVGPERLSGSFPPVVTDFWLSISANPIAGQFRVANLERREDHWYDVRARLAPGTTVDQARAAMHALAVSMGEAYPDIDRGRDITLRPVREVGLYPESETTLAVATAIVLTLLLLASANLANLLMVRGIDRSGEMAIRRALGAGSLRVARLYLIESVLLSIVGGGAGLLLAQAALLALPMAPLPPPFSSTLDLAIDGRIMLFALALMVSTGILFGLAPALRSARTHISGVLRADRRTSSLGRGMTRLRSGLIVLQVAGSFVLILAASLMGRSLVSMQRTDTGVDADRLAYVRTTFGRAGIEGPEAAVVLEELQARIRAIPGVTAVAAASGLPAQNSGTTTTIVEGYTPVTGSDAVELPFRVVTPGYFQTMGQALTRGRDFTARDIVGADRVVIVNEAASQRFWGGVDPIGRRLRSQGQPGVFRTVVGVATDAPVSTYPEAPVRPMFFVPSGQGLLGAPYLLAHTEGDPTSLLNPMRAALADVRASLPVSSQGTLAAHFGAALTVPRFLLRAIGTVSLLALLLAALGIYAVVAFNVARRSSELGIRVALGARPGRVVRMVIRDTVGAVAVGVGVGLAVGIAGARQLRSLLFEIGPLDPIAFTGAVGFLMGVATLAAYLPARRAARIDPVKALRAS